MESCKGSFQLAVFRFQCYTGCDMSQKRFAGECCEIAERRAIYQPDAAPPDFSSGD